MEIKIRYTFKRKSDGLIMQRVFGVLAIEGGNRELDIILNSGDFKVLGRDLWIGLQDNFKNEIYENDILERFGTKDIFQGSADDTPFNSPINLTTEVVKLNVCENKFGSTMFGYSLNREITYSERTNPATYKKIGDIYHNPELIEK